MDKSRIKVYVIDYNRKYLVLQWTDPTTNKRRSQSSKCTKKRDAERAAAELEDKLNSLAPRGDGSIAWSDFCFLYDEDHLQSLSDTSRSRSLGVLNVFQKHCDPAFLGNVTGAVLTGYAATLRKTQIGKPKKGEPPRFTSEATIATHMRTLRAALMWARANGHLYDLPTFPKQARAKRISAKGRPLTTNEFVKMLRITKSVVGEKMARSYRRLLIGLWRSGLRLDEALKLTWGNEDHASDIWVDMSGRFPLLGIHSDGQKSKKDELLPITPDFGLWLMKVPESKRTGYVFPIVKHRYEDVRRMASVSRTICDIGKAAQIVVSRSGKCASAHDLRRSFAQRWSLKTHPIELQALMRHASIATTQKYYAIHQASDFAESLWNRHATLHTTPAKTANHKERHNPGD